MFLGVEEIESLYSDLVDNKSKPSVSYLTDTSLDEKTPLSLLPLGLSPKENINSPVKLG